MRIYGIRHWIEQSCKQVKDELGWADFQVRSDIAIRHLEAEVAFCVRGVLSPLLANIALSALDDHFAGQWQQLMKTTWQRQARRKRGLGNWKMIRFADLCRGRHKSA